METPYQKRELDHAFNEIRDTLERIETQVLKTNGRVSGLEQWKWGVTGAVAVLTAIVLPLVFILIKNWVI